MVLQQSRGINWWAAAAGQTQVAQGRFWSFLGHCCSADLFPLFRRKLRKCTLVNVGEMYR